MKRSAFTLVELLLVMTIIVAAISITAPMLAGFFRGRTLDSEARRLLALAHGGQSRAVGEGVPMRLWVDAPQGAYGLEEDPGWTAHDLKAEEFTLDKDLHIEVIRADKPKTASATTGFSTSAQPKANTRNLPQIRFLPDGSVDESSPRAVRLFDRDGTSVWLAQATNGFNYELRKEFQ
jgi:prepilin-type N-terminal cleavage/methylation domain-containing protein